MRAPIVISMLRFPVTITGDQVLVSSIGTKSITEWKTLSVWDIHDYGEDFEKFYPTLVSLICTVQAHEQITFDHPPRTGDENIDMQNYYAYLKRNPKCALRGLQRAGIVGQDGELTERFRSDDD